MSNNKLCLFILDGLDEYNIYQLGLQSVQELYEDRGNIFTCATLPHTAVSNPMIWGGIENNSRFWVEREDGVDGSSGGEYVDPSQYFDRDNGGAVDGATGFSRRVDYSSESFIWDDLHAEGYDARALQVPIVLPPYSFGVTEELEDSWFPDKTGRMAEHIRRKPDLIKEQFEDGADFVATSIQMPDKWLHAIGEGKADQSWVLSEAPELDAQITNLIDYCDANDIEWAFFGDHGSPHPGAMKANGYILPRHRKESIIVSSDGIEPPTYSDEMYGWMKDYYGVESVDESWDSELEPSEKTIDDTVESRLQNLGYL